MKRKIDVLFLSNPDVLGPNWFFGLLVARSSESEFGIYWLKLSLAGGHRGFSPCPMDYLDVRNCLPSEWVGLAMDWVGHWSRHCHLHGWHIQAQRNSLLPIYGPINLYRL